MTPIPVLGVLAYMRGDLVTRMIQSIDYPVEKLVIVDNGVDDSVVESNNWVRQLRPDVVIYNPGYDQPQPVNLGYAGGCNWILRNYLRDWVLLVGSDMQFSAGDLTRISSHYESHKNDPVPVGMIDTNFGWNAVGITKAAVESIGYLDENYYPAYYEDCDYNWRHFLARKLGRLSYPAEGHCQIFARHEGSSTAKWMQAQQPQQYERLCQAFTRNVEYHIRKWGGAQMHEIFDHPFNNPVRDIRDWMLEPGRWDMNKLI